MANITIYELHPSELEYAELSDLELEVVVGGKERHADVGYSQEQGFHVSVGISF
jgi:hypothetical protein